MVVTAPTCGSCGVVPAVLYHLATSRDFLRIRILRALATAGLFGNIAKTNSSISGAEVGCQGEVGVACAMAAAAACQLFGGTPSQIEYAAEMGLEHHLGLTCDPVCGLVQVPCIERNAVAAARALDANIYATLSDGSHLVSYDKVVEVMNETGHNLPSLYRETSEGRSGEALRAEIARSDATVPVFPSAPADNEKPPRSCDRGRFFIRSCVTRLLRLLERFQLGLRSDDQIVVFAQTRTAGDQVTADHVLLEVLQRIDLGLDGRLVEHLGRLLERSRRNEARGLQSRTGDTPAEPASKSRERYRAPVRAADHGA